MKILIAVIAEFFFLGYYFQQSVLSPYLEHSVVYFRPAVVKDCTMQSSKCVIININVIIIENNVFIILQTP